MADEKFTIARGRHSNLPSNKISGRILVETDTGDMYLDVSTSERKKLADNPSQVNGHSVQSDVPPNAKFTDTTYSSLAAKSGGSDVSLVTTGEKYIWNSKTSNVGTLTGIKMNGVSKGTSGVVDLGKVLTGGSQTTTSTQDGGNNVYTFSDNSTITVRNGTKGSKGDIGPQGPQGEKGDTGTAATISVGTVTTGAAGTNAVVKNAGTSSAAKFNFTIPRGANGTSATWFTGTAVTGTSTTAVTVSVTGSKAGDMYLNTSTYNVYSATAANSWVYKCNIKGATGSAGSSGTSAGFGTPRATVDANTGTPSVTVTATGPNTAKVFNFAFKNLKGERGSDANITWGNIYVTNADEAPLGFSKISNEGVNNPFTFWVTLLTMGESETSGYKQQWAFPWGDAEATMQAPKYRVKDNGNWGNWTSLKDGGNANTVGGIAVTKLKGNDTKFIYTSQNGLDTKSLTEFKEEGHYFAFNYTDSPTIYGFLDVSVFDGSGFTPMPNGIIRQSWTDFVDPSKNYMRIYNSTSATEGSWTDWKRISDSGSDTKVTNTLNTTTKAYITGTTSDKTNTGTQIFDTGVYLDTTAGVLSAGSFKGGHQYNGTHTAWSYNNINSNFEKGNLPTSAENPYYWDLNFTDKNGVGHANRIGYVETSIHSDGRSKISLNICENKKSNTNFHSISITAKKQEDGTFKETVQLGSKTLGATNKPIYLSNGVITEGSACLPLTGGNITGNINIKSNTDNGVTLGRHIDSGSGDVSYGYIHLYNSGSIAGDIFGKLNSNGKRGIVIRPQDSGEGGIGDSSHYFGSAYINNVNGKVTKGAIKILSARINYNYDPSLAKSLKIPAQTGKTMVTIITSYNIPINSGNDKDKVAIHTFKLNSTEQSYTVYSSSTSFIIKINKDNSIVLNSNAASGTLNSYFDITLIYSTE